MINAKSKTRGFRVLLAGGQAVARLGLTVLLGSHEGIEVCDHAFGGREAVRLAKHNQPDLAIVDTGLSGIDAPGAVAAIHEVSPHTIVLLFTAVPMLSVVQEALDAGAAGYLSNSETDCEMLTTVRRALEGKLTHTPSAEAFTDARLGNARLRVVEPDSRKWESLTPREQEILPLLAQGRTNKMVALQLGISFRTVEAHRHHIMLKMGFTTITDLIRFAVRAHLIEL